MTTLQTLTDIPPKGTYDWLPNEFEVRKYIFDTWRKVCLKYGYQEYLTPLVEYADLYRAKSGEDIGGPELTVFEDRGGRELAIRPEMTPSVTRLVSKIYTSYQKPIRFFSIANFYRNEKPQRGRNREFWQLNFDMFGSEGLLSDLEILQMALDIMLAFNPPKGSFTLYLNNRKLIDAALPKVDSATKQDLIRILDKSEKLSTDDLKQRLTEIKLTTTQIDQVLDYCNGNYDFESLTEYKVCKDIITNLTNLGYGEWIKFKPNVIRGFDYYDGMVFEVFDNNPQNTRSMFGGGRYNGLASIFGKESFPAVGCAPGDETTKLFLESWNILPKNISGKTKVLVTIFSPELVNKSLELAKFLRDKDINTELYPDAGAKMEKQLKYANNKNIPYVLILGPEELANGAVKIKNMQTGEQKTCLPTDLDLT
jgi:histidyl-tRNA synthetase